MEIYFTNSENSGPSHFVKSFPQFQPLFLKLMWKICIALLVDFIALFYFISINYRCCIFISNAILAKFKFYIFVMFGFFFNLKSDFSTIVLQYFCLPPLKLLQWAALKNWHLTWCCSVLERHFSISK